MKSRWRMFACNDQKIKSVDKKLDLSSFNIFVMICLLRSFALAAARLLIENTRKASETESVPSAESFLPVKGKVSGPRWHCELILTLHN